MKITRNFKSRELKCPCCGVVKYDKELIDKLQILRNLMGCSITVTSGYRCKRFNTKIKGFHSSHHLTGKGADIKADNGKLSQLNKYAKLVFHQGGVGTYSGHVHVDTGKFLRFNGKYN